MFLEVVPLTPGKMEKVNEYAMKHLKKCHNCGDICLGVGSILKIKEHPTGASQTYGANVPMVQIVCSSCGYVHLLAISVIGVS